MTRILRIDSSPRGERSHSRALSQALTDALQKRHPDATVAYRDLGHNPPPFVTELWIAAAFSDPATHTPEMTEEISLSIEMVDELLASDIIVIGAPMYNFLVPAALKAYIDQVVRVGLTFAYPSYEGLAKGKKMFVMCARGGAGYGPGGQMEHANFQDPYLKAIFGLIGITDITFLHDEKTTAGDDDLPAAIEKARALAMA